MPNAGSPVNDRSDNICPGRAVHFLFTDWVDGPLPGQTGVVMVTDASTSRVESGDFNTCGGRCQSQPVQQVELFTSSKWSWSVVALWRSRGELVSCSPPRTSGEHNETTRKSWN
ncbi:unnamed protein product [Arctogadus glacialis]